MEIISISDVINLIFRQINLFLYRTHFILINHLLRKKRKYYILIAGLLLLQYPGLLSAQNSVASDRAEKKGFFSSLRVSGDIQTDMLMAQTDSVINAFAGDNMFKSNSYLRLSVRNKYLEAGVRGEYMKNPLPGFESDFAGSGIANAYIRMRYKVLDVTAGDFYDQFGSGLVFRTYEDRALGLDNSLRGGRIILYPFEGLTVKVLGGNQRYYFEKRKGALFGANVEMMFDEWVPFLGKNDYRVRLETSFADKYEPDELIMYDAEYKLNLPEYVPAASGKLTIQKGGLDMFVEYARKWNDPAFENNYIYKNGNSLLVSASYSKPGFSVLAQVKRNENMSFRSERSLSGSPLALNINYMPPFSMQHTYTLAALYPYATQKLGEWAFQNEWRYKARKSTLLGGRYGTDFHLSFSHIRPLCNTEKEIINTKGSTGYKPLFFETGDEVLYQDLTMDVTKKINPAITLTAMYVNQIYNQQKIEKEATNGAIVYSHIFITDTKIKINPKISLRTELQYLYTRQDEGDWVFGMLECSLFSNWIISVADTYNSGVTKLHYPKISSTYSYKAHRLQLGYGRTREGINCSGGVCRLVPASKGWSLTYNFNF